jgi:hypothetical protein
MAQHCGVVEAPVVIGILLLAISVAVAIVIIIIMEGVRVPLPLSMLAFLTLCRSLGRVNSESVCRKQPPSSRILLATFGLILMIH